MVIETSTHTRNSVSHTDDHRPMTTDGPFQETYPTTNEAEIKARNVQRDDRSDTSSKLSDPPPSPPASDSDDTMASEWEDLHPDSESDESSQYDDPKDASYAPATSKTPLSRLLVREIEDELHLTRSQGDLLHDLMQDEMNTASLLGSMNFAPSNMTSNDAALRPIFATVKEQLTFLGVAKVRKGRLRELLWARAMILNDNEKHNRWMVRAGKVKMRSNRTTYTVREEEQDEAAAQLVNEECPAPRHTSRRARPSFIAAELEDMDIGDTQHLETPSPMHTDEHVDEPVRTAAPPVTNSDFHPMAFIVRVVNNTTGAAVHTSQLMTKSQQNGNISADSLSFKTFVTLVSQQIGFDVTCRISGVIPKFHAIAPIDCKVGIGSEATWRAVLQAWQNTGRKTCEFVVEAEAVDG